MAYLKALNLSELCQMNSIRSMLDEGPQCGSDVITKMMNFK